VALTARRECAESNGCVGGIDSGVRVPPGREKYPSGSSHDWPGAIPIKKPKNGGAHAEDHPAFRWEEAIREAARG